MIPVTVRLSNLNVDAHVTSRLSGLSFRSVVPGGYASATFTLQSPISLNDPMLTAFTRVYIYDGRSGETLWEGRLAMPSRSAGDSGEVWALTAVGPSGHTLDQSAPLVYIDTRLDKWTRSTLEAAAMPAPATVSVGNHPNTSVFDAVICQCGPGVVNTTGTIAAALYEGFADTGMTIGAIGFSWDAGITSAVWNNELVVGAYPSYSTIPFAATMNIAGGTYVGYVVTDFAAGMDVAAVRIVKTSAGVSTTVGNDLWGTFANIRIIARRMLKDGTLVSGAAGMGSTSVYVRASWVVEDLLGRMLPQYDGANAILTGNTVDINQLVYDDPVTPSQVLDDMMALEPSTYWAAWESNAAGKYRFEWSTWPTTVRYEATVEDGFDSPAPTFEVYNRVRVRYRDARGRIKWLVQTQAIPMLDNEGIIRQGEVNLGDEVGSLGNATLAANNFLAEHRAPSSGGTLTVARPIRDIGMSRWAAPWEIVPGQLIRVRGIEASRALDDDTRDGVTVFRIVSVEPNGEGTATLELDMFTQTEQRQLATLFNKRARRR
jgi:hypothetical protein